jgi:hypothetical protein
VFKLSRTINLSVGVIAAAAALLSGAADAATGSMLVSPAATLDS